MPDPATPSPDRLHFPTKEAAIAWATAQKHAVEIEEPRNPVLRPNPYTDNFWTGRVENWTH